MATNNKEKPADGVPEFTEAEYSSALQALQRLERNARVRMGARTFLETDSELLIRALDRNTFIIAQAIMLAKVRNGGTT